jgi:hypothetical protein
MGPILSTNSWRCDYGILGKIELKQQPRDVGKFAFVIECRGGTILISGYPQAEERAVKASGT